MPGEGAGQAKEEQAPLGWAKTLLQRTNNGGFSEEDLRSKSFIELIDQKYKEKEDEKQNKNSNYDLPDLQKAKAAKAAYYEDRTSSTWRERLRYMWRPDEYGNLSPELQFVWETSFGSFLVAALFGSYTESAKIYRIFLEQNKYTMFQVISASVTKVILTASHHCSTLARPSARCRTAWCWRWCRAGGGRAGGWGCSPQSSPAPARASPSSGPSHRNTHTYVTPVYCFVSRLARDLCLLTCYL